MIYIKKDTPSGNALLVISNLNCIATGLLQPAVFFYLLKAVKPLCRNFL